MTINKRGELEKARGLNNSKRLKQGGLRGSGQSPEFEGARI
jgi:hypothetical protein